MKKLGTILLVVILGVAIGVLGTMVAEKVPSRARASKDFAPTYEYTELKTYNGEDDFSNMLDKGWQLIGITTNNNEVVFYFRKRK